VRIGRLALHAEGLSPAAARDFGRRVAGLLGEHLMTSGPPGSRHRTVLDVRVPAGLSDERLAAFVAREVRRQL
jgi:hypothetical protein